MKKCKNCGTAAYLSLTVDDRGRKTVFCEQCGETVIKNPTYKQQYKVLDIMACRLLIEFREKAPE